MKVLSAFVAFLGLCQGFAPSIQNGVTSTTSRNAIDGSIAESVVPVALFIASVAASIVKSGDSRTEEAAPSPVVSVKTPSAPAPAEKVISKKPEPVGPSPVPIVEPVTPKLATPKPVPEPVVPKPVAPRTKNLSDMKVKVASTLAGEREKMKRLEEKKRLAERNAEAAATAAAEEAASAEETSVEEISATPKKRSILRLVWRIVKKIVAPWRKWENIS